MRKTLSHFAAISFVSSLAAYLVIYVDSSAIAHYAGSGAIFPVYAFSAVLAMVTFFLASPMLRTIGNRGLLILYSAVQAGALLTLATGPGSTLGIIALICHLSSSPVIGYSLDLFLEERMPGEEWTNRARGLFLTAGNAALVISPLFAGSILFDRPFSTIYGLTFIVFCIFLALSLPAIVRFRDPKYAIVSLSGLRDAFHSRAAPAIVLQFFLRVYYAWMSMLLAVYLTRYLGYDWAHVGIILSMSLLPFFLFEIPMSRIPGERFSLRNMLTLGFVITGSSLVLLTLLPVPILSAVVGFLFMSRIGASLIEIGTETSFFSIVAASDEDAIMLFRICGPLGYLFGAAVASFLLLFLPLPQVFMCFGALLFLAAASAQKIVPLRQTGPIPASCRGSGLRC